ncbi:MAG: DNA-binding protein WhiA [Oscillospiraceae bacterium]|nr:DNA-binding protein WhiA [Oscillospiraceae bacterium]MBQ2861993.1 DNA-binding protein WhiA [Oscillospiraceae bacterium]MBQ2997939.1 DNA-binding protein WhiA [Oscillospiraceae bacterium]MBQ6699509.1 DNA-binding protein WhiA [Oscillospiraceae bacterium]
MSFAANLKDELCKDVPEEESAIHALLYGFLIFSHKFNADEISFSVVHEPTARLFAEALATHCGISAKIIFHERARGTLYKVSVEKASERRKVLEAFYHMPKEPTLRINRANIENEEDVPYFLRGAYLVCGSLTDPNKEYHLEFGVSYMNLCKDLLALVGEVLPQPKSAVRRGSYIVYYKESENIEDMLTYIGAVLSSLEMMNIKIEKDIKNRVNRRMNCDNANMDKTLNASLSQVADIKYIFEQKSESFLPEELYQVAKLRLENPEMSLRELCESVEPPLSRSGMNHRLKKISEIANNIRNGKI